MEPTTNRWKLKMGTNQAKKGIWIAYILLYIFYWKCSFCVYIGDANGIGVSVVGVVVAVVVTNTLECICLALKTNKMQINIQRNMILWQLPCMAHNTEKDSSASSSFEIIQRKSLVIYSIRFEFSYPRWRASNSSYALFFVIQNRSRSRKQLHQCNRKPTKFYTFLSLNICFRFNSISSFFFRIVTFLRLIFRIDQYTFWYSCSLVPTPVACAHIKHTY